MKSLNLQSPETARLVDTETSIVIRGDSIYFAGVTYPEKEQRHALPLFVAGYNSFNKAGRSLGVDATALAEKADLAGMVQILREFVAAHQQTPFGERFRSEAAFIRAKEVLAPVDELAPANAEFGESTTTTTVVLPEPIAIGDSVRVMVPETHHDEKPEE